MGFIIYFFAIILLSIFHIVFSIIWVNKLKKKLLDKKEIIQEKLNKQEKITVLILTVINPILSSLLIYYRLKRNYPKKAKQVNRITFLVYIISTIIGYLIALNWFYR